MINHSLLKHTQLTLVSLVIGSALYTATCAADEQQFFLDDWKPKTIAMPLYVAVAPSTQSATTTVTVDSTKILTKVSQSIYGHNAAGWAGQLNEDVSFLRDVSNLNPHIIRWPGGNLSNDYFWNASSKNTTPKDLPTNFKYGDLEYGANKNGWTMPLDSYYDMLAKTNAKGIICVNYAYARYSTSSDPVAAAAKYAADWVRYDNGRTRYWEIGNENYGDWETGYTIDTAQNKDGQPATISGALYGKHARVFIDAMREAAREVGNDIKIGVVAMDSEPSYNVVMRDWNKGLMPQIADKADYIILHSYYTPYDQNSAPDVILNSATTVTKTIKEYTLTSLKNYANHAPLPIALTEWNIFATGSGQGASYINGMHASLLLGETIKNNYGLATRWDFLNGWDNGNTHGLFSDGDEPGVTKHLPRAPFFYMYYFQKMFGDKMVSSTVTGNPNVMSYASTFSSGQSGLVLVNKSNSEQVVKVKANTLSAGTRYYYYVLTGGNDNGNFSRKVYVNGQTTDEAGGGPKNYASINPFSAVANGDITIALPKTSVVYLVIDKKAPTSSSSMPSSIAKSSAPKSSQPASSMPKSSSGSKSSVATLGKCKYTVTNEWNTGFTASIQIHNTGSTPINGWNISWNYNDGTTLTSHWNATLTGTNPYQATPLSWNTVIQPGQSIEFGFQGTKGSRPTAQTPTIAGSVCL